MHSLSVDGYPQPYYHEIIKDNLTDNKFLITVPEFVKVVIKDFNPKLSTKTILPIPMPLLSKVPSMESIKVSYPLENTLDSYVRIDVFTIENSFSNNATIWIGDTTCMEIPFEFGKKVQNFLLGLPNYTDKLPNHN